MANNKLFLLLSLSSVMDGDVDNPLDNLDMAKSWLVASELRLFSDSDLKYELFQLDKSYENKAIEK